MVRTFKELTLDELLTDPLVELVMRSDGLTRALVRELMDKAQPLITPSVPAAPRPEASAGWREGPTPAP